MLATSLNVAELLTEFISKERERIGRRILSAGFDRELRSEMNLFLGGENGTSSQTDEMSSEINRLLDATGQGDAPLRHVLKERAKSEAEEDLVVGDPVLLQKILAQLHVPAEIRNELAALTGDEGKISVDQLISLLERSAEADTPEPIQEPTVSGSLVTEVFQGMESASDPDAGSQEEVSLPAQAQFSLRDFGRLLSNKLNREIEKRFQEKLEVATSLQSSQGNEAPVVLDQGSTPILAQALYPAGSTVESVFEESEEDSPNGSPEPILETDSDSQAMESELIRMRRRALKHRQATIDRLRGGREEDALKRAKFMESDAASEPGDQQFPGITAEASAPNPEPPLQASEAPIPATPDGSSEGGGETDLPSGGEEAQEFQEADPVSQTSSENAQRKEGTASSVATDIADSMDGSSFSHASSHETPDGSTTQQHHAASHFDLPETVLGAQGSGSSSSSPAATESFASAHPGRLSFAHSVWPMELVEHFRRMVWERRHRLVLEVEPKHLGKLTLKVETRGNQVTAWIHTENHEVRSLLSRNADFLHELLAQHGLELEQFSVDVRDGSNSESQERETRFAQPRGVKGTSGIRGTANTSSLPGVMADPYSGTHLSLRA